MPIRPVNVTMCAALHVENVHVLYTEFDNILATLSDKAADAAESHGNLVGLYSTKPETAIEEWMSAFAADAGVDAGSVSRELGDVARSLATKLSAGDLSFQLLLPDDETPLPERVGALANWCQGYLYGLAQGGIQQFDGLPGDCSEILNDFVELTKARLDPAASGSDAEQENEGSERDFFELSEYVRVGAQLVFEELTEVSAGAATDAAKAH